MPGIREKNNVQSVIYLVSQLLVRKHSVFLTNFFFRKLHVLKQIPLIPEQLPNYIDISIKKMGTFSVTDDNKRCFVLHLLSKKLLIESESKSHSESPIDKSNYRRKHLQNLN